MLQRAQAAEKRLEEARRQIEDARNQIDTLEQLLEDARRDSANLNDAFSKRCRELAEETHKNRDIAPDRFPAVLFIKNKGGYNK